MKKNLLMVISFCGVLVACNGGGGSSDNSTGGSNDNNSRCELQENAKSCYSLTDLPYSYTVNHATGETINGYPVGDMRPFGSSLKIIYTVTNSYESMPIWFTKHNGSSEWLGFQLEGNNYKFYSEYPSGTCNNYTSGNPLQPKQSCTFILDIAGQNNFTESELFNFYNTTYGGSKFGFSYFFSGGELSYSQRVNTYVRAGSWYKNQQGYDLGLAADQSLGSFNVLNVGGSTANGGHDYIFPTHRVDQGNAQPFIAQFTESGLAYLNTSAPVTCPIPGCLNDAYITPLMYDIIWKSSGPELQTSLIPIWTGENTLVLGLDKRSYDRDGHGLIPNVDYLYAVQKDGTIVGQNTNGEYGCFNNDGSGFRALPALPVGYSWWWDLNYITSNSSVYDTMSYGDTNWITLTNSHRQQQRIKVVADNSGTCQFDFDNLIIDDVAVQANIGTVVPQTAQITPNGVYGVNVGSAYNNQSPFKFYKYPPRE